MLLLYYRKSRWDRLCELGGPAKMSPVMERFAVAKVLVLSFRLQQSTGWIWVLMASSCPTSILTPTHLSGHSCRLLSRATAQRTLRKGKHAPHGCFFPVLSKVSAGRDVFPEKTWRLRAFQCCGGQREELVSTLWRV